MPTSYWNGSGGMKNSIRKLRKTTKTIKRVTVPTGDILVVEGSMGKLECLSLADYGKEINVKCDAMGLSREPSPVRHTQLLPLDEKWVITISTQYGCSMRCGFCDVPQVGPGRNATFRDLIGQVQAGLALHPEVTHARRINVHYARMGEPTWNPSVIDSALFLLGCFSDRGWGFHPVVSTMMPIRNSRIDEFLLRWMVFKNEICGGNAGLQLSINSTDDYERLEMFGACAWDIDAIGRIMHTIPRPLGRKVTLNFALAGYTIDPDVLLRWFSPEHYLCKLTPMHKTTAALAAGIETKGDYTEYEPYRETEEALKRAGYDVIVFIASHEEDDSRITCGNAILTDGC